MFARPGPDAGLRPGKDRDGAAVRVEGVEDVVGKVGDVVVRIPGGDVPGEVSLVVHGIRELYLAHAREQVLIGHKVLVIHHRGDRTVDVEPWSVPS